MSFSNARWANPTWLQGQDVAPFWQQVSADPKTQVLYFSGLGFDPRMLLGMQTVLGAFPPERRECLLLTAQIDGVVEDVRLRDLTAENLKEAHKIIGTDVPPAIFPMFAGSEAVVGPRHINEYVAKVIQASSSTDWVIDISSLPRIIFIPLISMLLTQAERLRKNGKNQNVHIIVADNADIDRAIAGTGIDLSATPSLGFSSSIESDSKKHIPRIWIPILGDNQEGNMRNVKVYVDPSVILPMVPFPARDPRRPDSVLTSHRVLFEEFDVEVSNILYAGESNPFDVYQQLLAIASTYNDNLRDLGGANIIISPLSNKVQSIGACLAAHELKASGVLVSIVQTVPTEYRFSDADFGETNIQSLWLAGSDVSQ
jgi:hypothetical protein